MFGLWSKPTAQVTAPMPAAQPVAPVEAETWSTMTLPTPATASPVPAPAEFSTHLEAHPLADLFPMIEGAAFDELVASIKREGLLEPIILADGKILDGRNRYRACKQLGWEPEFLVFDKPDFASQARFVAAKNITRRHLSEAQRGISAARLAMLGGITIEAASESLSVSRATAVQGRAVLKAGDANVIRLIDAGAMSMNAAYAAVKGKAARTDDEKLSKMADDMYRLLAKNPAMSSATRTKLTALARTLGRASVAA